MSSNTSRDRMWLLLGVSLLLIGVGVMFFSSSYRWEKSAQISLTDSERNDLESLGSEYAQFEIMTLQGAPLGRKQESLMASITKEDPGVKKEYLASLEESGVIVVLEIGGESSEKELQERIDQQSLGGIKKIEENMAGSLLEDEGELMATDSNYIFSDVKEIVNTKSVIVAVIDSGVDRDHPAFADSVWMNTGESEGYDGVDDDHNGYVDDVYGWNFVDMDPENADENGHGTHISGIISARPTIFSDMKGVSGDSQIMILKVAGKDSGIVLSDVVAALLYAEKEGADVINMSFGFPEESEILHETIREIKEKGTFLIAASGNEASDIAQYPAAYPEVLSVGTVDLLGNRWKSSNYGDGVEISVPGEYLSTLPGKKYGIRSGTSQGAAFVTGLYSRILSKAPETSPEVIEQTIKKYTSRFEDGYLQTKKINDEEKKKLYANWIALSATLVREKKPIGANEFIDLKLNKYLTRQEMLALIVEFLEKRDVGDKVYENFLSKRYYYAMYKDVEMDSAFAPYILAADRLGFLSGEPGSFLNPKQVVRKEEAAKMLILGKGDPSPSIRDILLYVPREERRAYITRREFLELMGKVFASE